jgi:heavy metal sensor kinase
MFFRTLRFRLTSWYTLLLALTLAAFSAGVYLALRESLYDNLDDSLEARADIVAGIVAGADGELDVELPGEAVEADEFIRTFDVDGEVVFDNSSAEQKAPIDPTAVETALSGGSDTRKAEAAGLTVRVLVRPLRADGDVIGAVEVGLEDDVSETLNRLLLVIAVLYPIALLLAGAGGWYLVGRALGPIDSVTRAARRISAEDLSQRLDTEGLPDDEVGRLARTFDEMIARLDESFRRQRQFTADASHELRTPLTALKGQTEVALQRERTPEEYREVLQAVNADADRMIRLVGGLMTLARADAAQIPVPGDEVKLRAVINAAIEQARAAAAEKEIDVRLLDGDEVVVRADEGLVLQLVLNLLDNAVKYTHRGGKVEVSCRLDAGWAEVLVADNGPGISQENLDQIFDRFYRADAARSREAGAGLGLSICRWIVESHGGMISVESAPGEGSRFLARLPASS